MTKGLQLNKMKTNKSPGTDSLRKELCEDFWDHNKVCLFLSFKMVFRRRELSTFQIQAVIKLINKNDRDKRFTKNLRLISLPNVDVTVISKVL